MPSVIVHAKIGCPYSEKAVHFFEQRIGKFKEVVYDPQDVSYELKRKRLIAKTKHHTFPQIFIGKKFIGGYSDLLLLVEKNKLDKMLKTKT